MNEINREYQNFQSRNILQVLERWLTKESMWSKNHNVLYFDLTQSKVMWLEWSVSRLKMNAEQECG